MTTRRDLLRRLGITTALATTMLVLTAIFPEIANAACESNGCKCAVGTKVGVYCGWCGAVTKAGNGGKWSDLFQCNGSKCCVTVLAPAAPSIRLPNTGS